MVKIQGFVEAGNTTVTISGTGGTSTRKFQGSFPSATITVYLAGTVTLASIYSDNSGTSKANPFTAASTGTWFFYVANGRYDVAFSGGNIPTPFTLGDFWALDETSLFIDVTSTPYLAKGDGTTDDTASVLAALTALTAAGGGTLFFPEGTYNITRNSAAANISGDNIRILGVGPASILNGRGVIPLPNDEGNENYNLFRATSRRNITIENIAWQGYSALCNFDSCTNVSFNNVHGYGLLANASGYLYDKGIYLTKCNQVRVTNCFFRDIKFSVYCFGDNTTRCTDVTVVGNSFVHDVSAGSFTSDYPVGVYLVFCDGLVVSGNTFRNIYSSVDNGTESTGMGYGVYTGDGSERGIAVTGNSFFFLGNGSKRAVAIRVSDNGNQPYESSISANIIHGTGGLYKGIFLLDFGGSKTSINGNTMILPSTALGVGGQAVDIRCSVAASSASEFVVSNNSSRYGSIEVYQVSIDLSPVLVSIDSNIIDQSPYAGIILHSAQQARPMIAPKVSNNTISRAQTNGILLSQYVIQTILLSNKIIDCNQSAGAGATLAGIYFKDFSHGSVMLGNVIMNQDLSMTVGGGTIYGIANEDAPADRIYKDILVGNTFMLNRIGEVQGQQYVNYFAAEPTAGFYDMDVFDRIINTALVDQGIPAWTVINRRQSAITANASSASTTITVASTADIVAGDFILLIKGDSQGPGEYADPTKWHADEVLAVTGGTTFTIVTGIPAGDGTYASSNSILVVVRLLPDSNILILQSDKYTPTLTNQTNVAASTAYECQYTRIGDNVIVSGKVSIDPTAGGATSTDLYMTLPIAPINAFTSQERCGGCTQTEGGAGPGAAILAINVAGTNYARFNYGASDTANRNHYFTFMYSLTS